MASQGKFVSVNLNKSYGRQTSSSSSSGAASNLYGNGPRARVGSGGAAGGGMVVLSRPRSASSSGPKGGQRLAVPPPLNLPSLRKEHERFDLSAAAGRPPAAGSSALGLGHGQSTAGWTRPAVGPPSSGVEEGGVMGSDRPEKPVLGDQGGIGNHCYAPSGGQSAAHLPLATTRGLLTSERALTLRGEDFPSLSATFEPSKKQKDAVTQKQKQKGESEEPSVLQPEKPSCESPLYMRPHLRSSLVDDGRPDAVGGVSRSSAGQESSRRKDMFLPGLLSLPHARLGHTSNWDDDERDTGFGIPERDKSRGLQRSDTGRYGDLLDGRGFRPSEHAMASSKEFARDSHGRDLISSNREGRDTNSWRGLPPKEGLATREPGTDRTVNGRSLSHNREMGKENARYGQPPYIGGVSSTSQDPWRGVRELGAGHNTHPGRSGVETYNGRDADQKVRGRYGDVYNNPNRDLAQNTSRSSFLAATKGYSTSDPVPNLSRDRHVSSNSVKHYVDDAGFDSRDPFLGGFPGDVNVKVIKRKKDSMKRVDFHDPVRESFEAELERVQRLQELERQRVLEEQARALELARKEEEERERLAREEEERRRKLEEEAREAAWRAEQEKLEAARRAEEQKIAREEEKRRFFMEEERRKEAAHQKLMELEARIARRQAEVVTKNNRYPVTSGDEGLPGIVNENNKIVTQNVADIGDQDGEMIGNSTGSSDSANLSRPFRTDFRSFQSSGDGNISFNEREKLTGSWRRDANLYSSGVSPQVRENGSNDPKRDAFDAGRIFSGKDIHASPGAVPRSTSRGGISEHLQLLDDSRHSREQKWAITDEGGNHFSKSSNVDADSEFFENDRFGDVWRHHSPSSVPASYNDRIFQNPEIDGFPAFGRSRHSLRQPRVLPPPSFSSLHRGAFRIAPECPGSSVSAENELRHQSQRVDDEIVRTRFENGYHENLQQSIAVASSEQLAISLEPDVEEASPRCDSQSSLSVTSPPGSPLHLSHDELDDSGDSPSMPASVRREHLAFSDDEHAPIEIDTELTKKLTLSPVSPVEDDEWAIENNAELQNQEEFYEDDSYHEEDEAHDGDDENLDLVQELSKLHSDTQNVTDHMDQLVLGYDDGVQVCIYSSSSEKEKSGGIPERETGKQSELVGSLTESESVEALIGHNETHAQPMNAHSDEIREDISKVTCGLEKAMEDLVIESVTSLSYPAENTSTVSFHSSSSASLSTVPFASSVSTVPTQTEVPLKLQFGLFSSPSLIQPPIPTIQIGSIQMPLHMHPPLGPSLTHMHPSQPPFFQFDQMRHLSSMGQGILPLSPHNIPFVHPTIPAQYSLNQKCGGSLHDQMFQDSSVHSSQIKDDSVVQTNNELMTPICGPPKENLCDNEFGVTSDSLKIGVSKADTTATGENGINTELISHLDQQAKHEACQLKNHLIPVKNKVQAYAQHTSHPLLSEQKVISGRKYLTSSGSRGKRFVYKVKDSGSRSLLPAPEHLNHELSNLQKKPRRNIRRTEFRTREYGGRHIEALELSNFIMEDERPKFNVKGPVIPSRNVVKKDWFLNKPNRMTIDPDRIAYSSSVSRLVSESKTGRTLGKEALTKRSVSAIDDPHASIGHLKRRENPEEDIDAPLQSGIVRVFKQPGIETPSDEDDFIEVRSKRQMLNDRREQREKEIKAKSKAMKTNRKPYYVAQENAFSSSSNKARASMGDVTKINGSTSLVTDVTSFVHQETSTVPMAVMTSQALAPIGTSTISVDSDVRSHKMSIRMASMPVVSAGGTQLTGDLPFKKHNVAIGDASSFIGSWNNEHLNQQMVSAHSQLDEAMKSPHFVTHITSIGDHRGIIVEPRNMPSSVESQENQYHSSANSLNSVISGEKIQFGAVTSPIHPGASRVVSRISAPDNEVPMFFEKENHQNESPVRLDDPEAEAEAAASAVAVAAISNDEPVGSGLGTCDVKSVDGVSSLTSPGNHVTTGQSTAEESLTVALPADLSVDTPSLSLWPPLPSPQSSGTMLSQFPGAAPSNFPCFEMNPMLGGPFFAFGPNDESIGAQSQQQRSNTLGTAPLGAWPACHSGLDSFYGHPAGFTGPFISPPVGIPGVQGPPHMVVYNHFTPVGQFGQLGLGFMGTAYIPGKQPDWKHNSIAPSVGVSEGDNNMNVASLQRAPTGVPSSIQHLAPGSPLMPMASSLTMFDMSPFQSSADLPVQARWSHLPAPPLHSVPLSVPLQQYQVDGVASQFGSSVPSDSAVVANSRFHETRSSMPLDPNGNFAVSSDSASHFPDELGLVETPSTILGTVQTSRASSYMSAENNGKGLNGSRGLTRDSGVGNNEHGGIGTTSSSANCHMKGSVIKPPVPQSSAPSSQHYLQAVGYSDQKSSGLSAQKVSGSEWHRRTGFQGKNQPTGSDKNLTTTKMKQIYVAKPSAIGNTPS